MSNNPVMSNEPVVIDNGDLSGRTALVTGAGRGIGQAIAVELAHAGVRSVAVVARTRAQLEQTADLLRELDVTVAVIQADLAVPADRAAVITAANGSLGQVDVLVNNAATVEPLQASVGLDSQRWAAAIELNLVAPVALTLQLLPGMLDRGWGRVVNVSSAAAGDPSRMINMNAYTTSKAALEAHTHNLAAELDGSGVTVNAYRPGTVDTAMQTWIRGQDPEQIGAHIHTMFVGMYENESLSTPESSAASLVTRMAGPATGQIWDVSDTPNPAPSAPLARARNGHGPVLSEHSAPLVNPRPV